MHCLQSRIKVRVVCARAYHALFMHNMMIRPTEQELAVFGKPDFTIFNAGAFPVNRYTSYMSSSTSVDVNLRCGTVKIPDCQLLIAVYCVASTNLSCATNCTTAGLGYPWDERDTRSEVGGVR